nr:hypothetical protein Itr_chr13CG08220 [Ipomoea trifida]
MSLIGLIIKEGKHDIHKVFFLFRFQISFCSMLLKPPICSTIHFLSSLPHSLLVPSQIHPSQPGDKIRHRHLSKQLKQAPNGLQELAFFSHFFLPKKHSYGEVDNQPGKPLPHLHYHRPRIWILVV